LPLARCIFCWQASVPRETKLVITVQRASNLPRRIAAGGGGVRAQSPNRVNGEQTAAAQALRVSTLSAATNLSETHKKLFIVCVFLAKSFLTVFLQQRLQVSASRHQLLLLLWRRLCR
jgi:hypothetical protein